MTKSAAELYKSVHIKTLEFKQQFPGFETDIMIQEDRPKTYEEITRPQSSTDWNAQKRK